MNQITADNATATPPDATHAHARRKREIILGAIGFVAGFIVLPLLIYVVGMLLLGPYAGGKSIGAFFVEFYGNLIHGAPRTWFIAVSPYLAIWLVRLCVRRYPFGEWSRRWGRPSTQAPSETPPAQTPPTGTRREPFVGS
ncbi:MAG TPA: hypothetical protein VET48_08055 [Steroidobacteraceae bacterium]|nr:hypothetical protein [Steroidobacteraceae bacterium]